MKLRRVVTGHIDGRSTFVGDELLHPLRWTGQPGSEFHDVWGEDHAPQLPISCPAPRPMSFIPPVGGYRFVVHRIPPSIAAKITGFSEGTTPSLEDVLPGIGQYLEPDEPGMHATPSVDMAIVLEGELVLELDGGSERTLYAGDTVVQCGTRHRWHNRGGQDALVVFFLVGASTT